MIFAPESVVVLLGLVAEPISRHPRMTREDHNRLQLLLSFFRNLLVIPSTSATATGAAAQGNHKMRLQVRGPQDEAAGGGGGSG